MRDATRKVPDRGLSIYALRVERAAEEERLEDALVKVLERRGIAYERRVRTSCGIADVVTEDTVYEVKYLLTHDVLFKAFGQVSLYAAALGRPRRVIVGYETKTTKVMLEVIRGQGVEVNVVP